MYPKLFILLTIAFTNVASHSFSFKPNNKISKLENWQRKDRPCYGDKIVFEPAKKTIVFLDKSIDVSKIELPDDGVLMFDNNVQLPMADKFQCARRKTSEDVYFEPDNYFASLHDWRSWNYEHEPLLHMNMVPSALDHVEFFNFSQQFFLDDQISVKSFKFAGKKMSEADFFNLLHTMEGQYKIELGHALAIHRNKVDEEFVIPNRNPVLLTKETNKEPDDLGVRNPNSNPETMKLICNYVNCPVVPPNCLEAIQPIGHCCQFCGATANFTGLTTNMNEIYSKVFSVLTESMLNELMWFSLERIDHREIQPATYQLTLFPTNETTAHVHVQYDDYLFESVMMMIKNRLMNKHVNSLDVISFHFVYSKIDRSIRTSSKIIGGIVFFFLLVAAIVYFICNDEELYRRISPYFRASTFAGVVLWSRGNGDDIIELVNPVEATQSKEKEDLSENLQSDEEEPTTPAKDKKHEDAAEQTTSSEPKQFMEEMALIEF